MSEIPIVATLAIAVAALILAMWALFAVRRAASEAANAIELVRRAYELANTSKRLADGVALAANIRSVFARSMRQYRDDPDTMKLQGIIDRLQHPSE